MKSNQIIPLRVLLTARQLQVALWVADGLTNAVIAKQTQVTTRAVTVVLCRIYTILGYEYRSNYNPRSLLVRRVIMEYGLEYESQ